MEIKEGYFIFIGVKEHAPIKVLNMFGMYGYCGITPAWKVLRAHINVGDSDVIVFPSYKEANYFTGLINALPEMEEEDITAYIGYRKWNEGVQKYWPEFFCTRFTIPKIQVKAFLKKFERKQVLYKS